MFGNNKSIASLLAILGVSAVAAAAVTLSFSNTSTVTSEVTPAPVVFAAGSDAGTGTYVSGWTLSSNATYFSVTLKGVPEMALTVGDLFHVTNQDTSAHSVTISAPQVTSAHITTYSIAFYNGGSLVGTLNLKDASPSLTLTDIPASTTYTARVTLALATGAGNHNAQATTTFTMAVT